MNFLSQLRFRKEKNTIQWQWKSFWPLFPIFLVSRLSGKEKKIYATFRYRKLIHDNSIPSNRKQIQENKEKILNYGYMNFQL